jgi:hypothetical protein
LLNFNYWTEYTLFQWYFCDESRLYLDLPGSQIGELVGVSGQSGAISQPIVESMGQHVERPIVFALSNPTSKA